MEKTNALRILEKAGISFAEHAYDPTLTDAEAVAKSIGQSADVVFKTLVTTGSDKKNYVFVIPASCRLSLKKAAAAAKVKSVEMLKQKDLFALTGYIHGGCSPVGMKKPFATCFDETAELYDRIFVSAGRVGLQMELQPQTLLQFIGATTADLTER